MREFLEPMEESGTDAAVGLLERYGIDALLCGTIDDTERTAVGMAGIMLFPGYSGKADDAALRFLSGSVVSDPNNHCKRLRLQRSVLPEGQRRLRRQLNSKKEQAFGLLLFCLILLRCGARGGEEVRVDPAKLTVTLTNVHPSCLAAACTSLPSDTVVTLS